MNNPTVFLSSTYQDLKEHRLLLLDILQKLSVPTIAMEDFGALPGAPESECKRAVLASSLYVLILGTRYGALTKSGLSMTEVEYDTARQNGISTLAGC